MFPKYIHDFLVTNKDLLNFNMKKNYSFKEIKFNMVFENLNTLGIAFFHKKYTLYSILR